MSTLTALSIYFLVTFLAVVMNCWSNMSGQYQFCTIQQNEEWTRSLWTYDSIAFKSEKRKYNIWEYDFTNGSLKKDINSTGNEILKQQLIPTMFTKPIVIHNITDKQEKKYNGFKQYLTIRKQYDAIIKLTE